MKQKLLSLCLAAALCLGLTVPAFAAEEDPWADAKEVQTYDEFKAALADAAVEAIKVTGEIEVTEDTETAKSILVGKEASLSVAEGKVLSSTAPMGRFYYEDIENMWDQIRRDFAAFLLWKDGDDCYRKAYGTFEDGLADITSTEHGALETVSLNGDLTLEQDTEITMLVMEGVLTLKEGVQATIGNCYGNGGLVLEKDAKLSSTGRASSDHDFTLGEGASVECETFFAGEKLTLGKGASVTGTGDSFVQGNTVLGEGSSFEMHMAGFEGDLTLETGAKLTSTGVDEYGTGVFVHSEIVLGKDAQVKTTRLYGEKNISLDAGAVVESADSFVEGEIVLKDGAVMPANLGSGAADENPETPAPVFSDVPADAYYAAPVAWAVEQKITNGTSDTTFTPDQTCTTAQILTFLWRASGSPASETACPADGLDAASPYYTALCWAAETGLTAAPMDPDAPCTRASTVLYLWKAAGSPEAKIVTSFDDVTSDAEYAAAVAWAVEQEITNGTTEITFTPDQTCTRGQIATFLYRDLAEKE